jgi:hypothetical protein
MPMVIDVQCGWTTVSLAGSSVFMDRKPAKKVEKERDSVQLFTICGATTRNIRTKVEQLCYFSVFFDQLGTNFSISSTYYLHFLFTLLTVPSIASIISVMSVIVVFCDFDFYV